MKVIGMTTSSEAYIVERENPIRINEYLKIRDKNQGDLICETTKTHAYNRFMPLKPDSDMADTHVLEVLKDLGYDIDNEKIYIAKVRLLSEAPYPIETGSEVVVPEFDEIKDILIRTDDKKGLVLGAIKNTDELYKYADEKYKDLFTMFEDKEDREQYELPAIFDLWSMKDYPHIGIFGGSGSGKSYGIRVFIEELMRLNIPTIVSDPHNEMSFESDDDRFKDKYTIFNVGVDAGIEFKDLSSFDLIYLLKSAGDLSDAQSSFIEMALEKNESADNFNTKIESLIELLEIGTSADIEKYIADNPGPEGNRISTLYKNYKRFVRSSNLSVIKAIRWRFKRIESTGIFNFTSRDIINAMKQSKTVVIRGEMRILLVYMSYILRSLYYMRRTYKDEHDGSAEHFFPPFVSVIDEAHNFAPKGDPRPSKAIIREIAQEGRKYGVFLALATQRPSILDDTTTAQLNSKFIFRTTRQTDIQTIKEETDISPDESARLPYLRSGNVFFSSAVMGRTMFIRIRKAISHQPKSENPFDELGMMKESMDEEIVEILDRFLPVKVLDLNIVMTELSKAGKGMDSKELIAFLDRKSGEGYYKKTETPFGDKYEKA